MRITILAATLGLIVGAAVPAAAAAAPTVFDRETARDFCAAGPAEAAEECLSDQETAARRIDHWLIYGDLPRYLSRRAYSSCQAFYGPDLRQVWACIEDNQDDRRDGRGFLSRQGAAFGR